MRVAKRLQGKYWDEAVQFKVSFAGLGGATLASTRRDRKLRGPPKLRGVLLDGDAPVKLGKKWNGRIGWKPE